MRKPGIPPSSQLLANRINAIGAAPANIIHDDAPRHPPRALRQTIYKPAVLKLERGERLEVIIRNVSATGVRVEFFRQTPVSQIVVLDEATLRLHLRARVVWQRDGASGLYFIDR